MNETDLIQAINGIDDRYLNESEELHKKRGRIRKPYVSVIIAAAILVVAIPVCAMKLYEFLHRDNMGQEVPGTNMVQDDIEHTIPGTDLAAQNQTNDGTYLLVDRNDYCLTLDELAALENPDIIKNLVAKNDDYRLTLDALISDGHNVMILFTSEAISEYGKKHFKKLKVGRDFEDYYSPAFCIKYADGLGGPSHHSTVSNVDFPIVEHSYVVFDHTEETKVQDDIRSQSFVGCRGLDLSKDVKLEMFANEDSLSANRYFENQNPEIVAKLADGPEDIINYLDGIEFTVNFTPNVTCNTLYDAEGRMIYLSPFELYTEDPDVFPRGVLCDITFIKDSGERIIYDTKDGRSRGKSGRMFSGEFEAGMFFGDFFEAGMFFGDFIDPNEFVGVEVNGVEYWIK